MLMYPYMHQQRGTLMYMKCIQNVVVFIILYFLQDAFFEVAYYFYERIISSLEIPHQIILNIRIYTLYIHFLMGVKLIFSILSQALSEGFYVFLRYWLQQFYFFLFLLEKIFPRTGILFLLF